MEYGEKPVAEGFSLLVAKQRSGGIEPSRRADNPHSSGYSDPCVDSNILHCGDKRWALIGCNGLREPGRRKHMVCEYWAVSSAEVDVVGPHAARWIRGVDLPG